MPVQEPLHGYDAGGMSITLLICRVHHDIEDYFNKIVDAGIAIEGQKIYVLKYADDLVLIATSEDDLQKSLNSLYSYWAQYKLTVNRSKRRIMHFTKKINTRNTTYYRQLPYH